MMDDIPAKSTVRANDTDASDPQRKPLGVVGIGAGAGGLEAIQLLFGAMPLDAALAFVLCRRVGSGLADPLADLLRAQTALPVVCAENGTALEPDRIHLVAPEARMILLKNRLFSLESQCEDEADLSIEPIDLLLHSIAASIGPAAIAVMLSGNDRDGVRGCASIRDFGGLVLAQHPESTEFAEMPRRVIEADLASAVAPPGAMPDLIWRHIGKMRASLGASTAPSRDPMEEGGGDKDVTQRTRGDADALLRITGLLETRFAIDAHAYRPSLLARHICRRLAMSTADTLERYADLLAIDDAELSALHDDLLIRVTGFFRDPEAFAVLARDVVPRLVERMSEERPIRVWVPACASGEEAYSLAMLILDRAERANKPPHLQILASDRHASSLKRARHGRYRRDRLGRTPPELIERYMIVEGERAEIGAGLRRHVTFVDHDILRAPPPDDIDLVSCRNLLIYLARASRDKALQACSEALRPGGFLFLGPSEQPGPLLTGLATIHGKWRIYQKAAAAGVDRSLEKLVRASRRKPAETILPAGDEGPGALEPPSPAPPDPSHRAHLSGLAHHSDLDSVMAENQRMLESTIDTLLASNDTLRQRNRDLRAENRQLASAHAALDDVATMIAHDLKAPLRTIDNLSGRVRAAIADQPASAEGVSKEAGRWLQPIQHQIIALNRLIDDLLAYARRGPTDGSDLEVVNIGDLLREALTLIGLPQGIKVLMRPPSLEVTTWRIPLACILRNLLSRSIERIGTGSGGIRVDVKLTDRFLDIAITDDGRNTDQGSGDLGIAIVRQLLDGAGGRLTSDSDPTVPGHHVQVSWPIEHAADEVAN